MILVGERLAHRPWRPSAAAADLAARTGARLAWVPRRAGDRGAVEAGCLPTLLPGGRPVADAGARVDMAAAWGVQHVPEADGRDADAIVAGLADGSWEPWSSVVSTPTTRPIPRAPAPRSTLRSWWRSRSARPT